MQESRRAKEESRSAIEQNAFVRINHEASPLLKKGDVKKRRRRSVIAEVMSRFWD